MLLIVLEISFIFAGGILIGFRNKLSYLGMLLCSLFISFPDLYYVPSKADDLSRYFQDMNLIQPYDNISSMVKAFHIIPTLSHYSSNYIYDIFEWLIARSGNYELLAFLSVFIVCCCITFPIIHEFIVDRHYNIKMLLLGLMMVMSLFSYSGISSTVRWYIGMAIFFSILYISCTCKHPLITIPFYLLLLFIHEGLIIPIILAIICIIIKNIHISGRLYIIFGILFLFVIYFAKYISNNSLIRIFNAYNSLNVYSAIIHWNLSALIYFFGVLIVSYIYLLSGLYLIRHNNGLNWSLEYKMLIIFTLVDILLAPANPMIPVRYSMCVGFIGILIYLKVIHYNGIISYKLKYTYIITSGIYLLLTWSASISEMNFNFSQMNYLGIFHS